jgi:hypothetical protein
VHKHEYEGKTYYVRSLSGSGRAKFLSLQTDDKAHMAKVVALGLCEEDGALTYNIDNESDIAEVLECDGATLQSIAFKLYAVSGLSSKALEEAEKNS